MQKQLYTSSHTRAAASAATLSVGGLTTQRRPCASLATCLAHAADRALLGCSSWTRFHARTAVPSHSFARMGKTPRPIYISVRVRPRTRNNPNQNSVRHRCRAQAPLRLAHTSSRAPHRAATVFMPSHLAVFFFCWHRCRLWMG